LGATLEAERQRSLRVRVSLKCRMFTSTRTLKLRWRSASRVAPKHHPQRMPDNILGEQPPAQNEQDPQSQGNAGNA
jgi:hypothetical protein